jgi:hypothetical protein
MAGAYLEYEKATEVAGPLIWLSKGSVLRYKWLLVPDGVSVTVHPAVAIDFSVMLWFRDTFTAEEPPTPGRFEWIG